MEEKKVDQIFKKKSILLNLNFIINATLGKTEIRTLLSLLYPPPPSPNPQTKASHHQTTGSLDIEKNLGKRMINIDQSCIALCTEIHEPFIRTVQLNKKNSSQFAEKRNEEIVIIYALILL